MPNKTNPFQTKKSTKKSTKNLDKPNASETDTSFKQTTLQQTKETIELQNKTNALQTDQSTELDQKHIQAIEDQTNKQFQITIEHLYSNEYQRTIQSIQDLSIQMFKETLNIQENLKNKAPDITHTLNIIKKYVDQILKETGHIRQILKNMPDATKALQTDATFDKTKQNEKHKTQQHFQHKTQTTSKQH